MPRTRVTLISIAMALIVASCGSDAASTDGTNATGDRPAIAAICEEGVVDCDDTPDPGGLEPSDNDGGAIVNSGALVNGGLTVQEALSTDATGVLAVKGFLVADQTTIRLCDLLAESLPPQCGGASVTIAVDGGVDQLVFDDEIPLESAQNVTWTNSFITLFGELVDGELVISPAVS